MSSKVKHVLGISGGKDSAALAIYMRDNYPELAVEYYTCDTGKELKETYELIDNLEIYLGQKITQLVGAPDTPEKTPFDHFLALKRGYLPSNFSRWCTLDMKLKPFEKYLPTDIPVVSYVGIRGDEDREGYISTKPNIQSIFPFRKNIWSEDVIQKVLANNQIEFITRLYETYGGSPKIERVLEVVKQPLTSYFTRTQKLETLLELGIKEFNRVVFGFLKTTDYPLGKVDSFPLVENEEELIRADIFQILRKTVGVPAYYELKEYHVEIDGEMKTGYYSRSRSGCFFCFFQQKIEWVWLFENHPELFKESMTYEREGYSWIDKETLEELSQPERVEGIKREHYIRMQRNKSKSKSDLLSDLLDDAEGEGCAACFI
jgi:3'-phosphoadenosine 5'-phosphosulfate sulfotransferase (PAPS reductase)/FAD synthetase